MTLLKRARYIARNDVILHLDLTDGVFTLRLQSRVDDTLYGYIEMGKPSWEKGVCEEWAEELAKMIRQLYRDREDYF